MNELLFFGHVVAVVLFSFGALRLGKETLISLAALQAVLANLFVLKQTLLFGWNVTCSDVFAVGSLLSLNLLQERFGKESAKKAVWVCFFGMLFFTAMSQVHLVYTPSPDDTAHPHFSALLAAAPRLLAASLLSFFLVQQADVRLFAFLRRLGLSLASFLALAISQLLDTLLFSVLGLWGIVSHLGPIIAASFLVKLAITAGMSAAAFFFRRRLPDAV